MVRVDAWSGALRAHPRRERESNVTEVAVTGTARFQRFVAVLSAYGRDLTSALSPERGGKRSKKSLDDPPTRAPLLGLIYTHDPLAFLLLKLQFTRFVF